MNQKQRTIEILQNKNCKLIKFEGQDVYYQDSNGYRYKKNIYNKNLQNSISKHRFDVKNSYCIYNIERILSENNPYNTKIVPQTYIGSTKKSVFICGKCGGTFEDLLWNVIDYQHKVCPRCIHKVQNTKLQKFSNIKEEVESYGYYMLDEKWVGNHSRVTVQDKDGYKGRIKMETLRCGGSFSRFSVHNPFSLENLKHYCKINGLECSIVNQKYVNCNCIKAKCECGKIFETSISSLLYRKESRCIECRKTQSSLEIKVKEFLMQNDIEFTEQKVFEGCYYKKSLRFDFYLPKFNILIEVQGGQHYNPVKLFGGKRNLELQKKRDKIKKDFCNYNKIFLLEIPYWSFDKNDSYKDIILKTLWTHDRQ